MATLEMEEELKFTCPFCGCTDFGLIQTGMTMYSPILSVNANGRITWGRPDGDFDDYEESWYQCAHCNYQLENDGENIQDEEELVERLRNNGNQQKPDSME